MELGHFKPLVLVHFARLLAREDAYRPIARNVADGRAFATGWSSCRQGSGPLDRARPLGEITLASSAMGRRGSGTPSRTESDRGRQRNKAHKRAVVSSEPVTT
jgi:hypothetical protein